MKILAQSSSAIKTNRLLEIIWWAENWKQHGTTSILSVHILKAVCSCHPHISETAQKKGEKKVQRRVRKRAQFPYKQLSSLEVLWSGYHKRFENSPVSSKRWIMTALTDWLLEEASHTSRKQWVQQARSMSFSACQTFKKWYNPHLMSTDSADLWFAPTGVLSPTWAETPSSWRADSLAQSCSPLNLAMSTAG